MNSQIEKIKHDLCRSFCTDFTVSQTDQGSIFVSTPFSFQDGDAFSFYVDLLSTGGVRISDKGTTMMHLSYEHDVDKFTEGNRGRLFNQILAESGVNNDDGEIYIDTNDANMAAAIITLGQALTKVLDLSFLNRVQVENTFMEDLERELLDIAGENLVVDYKPDIEDAETYRVDFCVTRPHMPLLIWGVSNSNKARLATITIQHLQQVKFPFRSLVVYQDMMSIPQKDIIRLTNAANDQVSSLGERNALERKIKTA